MSSVQRWTREYGFSGESVDRGVSSGAPRTSSTEENVAVVRRLIEDNRRISIRKIGQLTGLANTSIRRIIHEYLGYMEIQARWVPKDLTRDTFYMPPSELHKMYIK